MHMHLVKYLKENINYKNLNSKQIVFVCKLLKIFQYICKTSKLRLSSKLIINIWAQFLYKLSIFAKY